MKHSKRKQSSFYQLLIEFPPQVFSGYVLRIPAVAELRLPKAG